MYGFVAVVFDGHRTARKALDALADHDPAGIWVEDLAVLSRGKLGVTHIHSTWAQDDSDVGAGGKWGLITGGLIGLLFGPGGAMAGAALGGSLGAMGGATKEMMLEDPRLDELAVALVKDSSALVLVGERSTLADFLYAVEPLRGKVFKGDLSEATIHALRKGLKAVA
ncbi:DUF1269 domain-containing protein [Aliiruegeria sabulilitoris]|uniref:DUF1269 domain-containing protein n=1 Tax=Aliiruegeria sabulilitoris TaxID=1510458 RepID=UPI00082A1128|nr:DUF1269 domain-containing protein [Aliiruegeria sabulilitoris]NDR56327.1 DUF1269 domain-containing protein [Pseudoruegeria sp. M32A2M]